MFKSQMRYQKILCIACLILAAILFVYAIGFITPIYDQYFLALDRDLGDDYSRVDGAQIFWELQSVVTYERVPIYDEYDNVVGYDTVKNKTIGFVDEMLGVAIADICVALVLFITNTHRRRKYYISNYVATGAFVGYNVAVAIWMTIRLTYFIGKFSLINLDQLKEFCELYAVEYNPQASITIMYLGIALAVVLILAAVAVALNLVWKILLQKRENKLLSQSPVQEVAVNG